MSYDIKIDGIKTHGKHGVYEFEKIENQLFLIDLHIILNNDTVVDDQIETTINYADYVEKVEELVASSSFNLIETLAKYIYENLIDDLIIFISNRNLLKNGSSNIKKELKTFLSKKEIINEKVNLFGDKLIKYKLK